jgi:hypothetical protein
MNNLHDLQATMLARNRIKQQRQPSTTQRPRTSNPSACLPFTRYTSEQPARLTKTLSLDNSGQLVKKSGADMVRGQCEHMQALGLDELAVVLEALTPDQAVSWGIPNDSAHGTVLGIVTQEAHRTAPEPGTIPRDREHLSYPSGPGVLMLDHDGGNDGEALTLDELRARLIEVCPALEHAPMLCRPSASAGIVAPDGRELTGQHKHRIYIPATRATDIPEAGARLITLLWAAARDAPGRYAWGVVGQAGQVLLRGLLDAQVWQPERLDFAAAPVLADGLHRAGAAARRYGDPLTLFDLNEIRVDPSQEKAAQEAQQSARKALAPQARAMREQWAAAKAPALAQRRGIPAEKARAILMRAAGEHVLMGDFELLTQAGARVSVGEVLDCADRWHNTRFADPLDPDEDLRVAWVNLKSGGRPYLGTHRHGGMRFELRRQSARVQVGAGRRIEATDAVLQVLRDRGELYEFGDGAVAYITEGRARPVSLDWLTDHMGRVCEFYRLRRKMDAQGAVVNEEIPDDAPGTIARSILAKHGSRGFARLVGVVTAPTLRQDGSVLDRPGYDPESGLVYWSEHPSPPAIAEQVTTTQALEALRVLWQPVRQFPLVDDVARGVVLHGLLTAAIRTSLPTAPGIGVDAPAAGSGKTLLARCIGILATGAEPAILPPTDTDDETRKRLFSALRDGHRVILFDNVREPLGNQALDSFLTAATFADRILGSSETASLPNRALFIATGNNLRLSSDTCRRVLLARMDAESETPYKRDFEFDPARTCQTDRLRYISAAMTIIRAHISAGRPKEAGGRTASFEVWDDLVRQPLCWLASLVNAHNAAHPHDLLPTFADPMEAAALAFDADPETMKHHALLDAWHARFLDRPTTVNQAIHAAGQDGTLMNALDEIGGQGGKINVRLVSRWLDRMQGRITEGMRFTRGSRSAAGQTWIAKRAHNPGRNDSTESTHSTFAGVSRAAEAGISAVSADSAVVFDQVAKHLGDFTDAGVPP